MENDLLKAYAEVDKILSFMETKYVEKVPSKMREMFKKEKLTGYIPKINKNIPLDKQNLQRKTLAILTLLNLNYWCEDEIEKQELIKIYTENDRKKEEELREKYNPDNIFKRKDINQEMNEITAIVEYKEENIFKKILNKIIRLFKK